MNYFIPTNNALNYEASTHSIGGVRTLSDYTDNAASNSSNPHARENFTLFILCGHSEGFNELNRLLLSSLRYTVFRNRLSSRNMNEPPGGRRSHCGVLRVGVLFVLSPLAFVCRVLSKDLEERADSLPRRANITHAAPRGIDPVPSGMRRCLASQNPTVACLRAAPRRVHCFISTSSSRTWWEVGRF